MRIGQWNIRLKRWAVVFERAGEAGGIGELCVRGERQMSDPCSKPPDGWYCTRLAGHAGPCAAISLVKPAGWAYQYPDGFIRFNHGEEVNGSRAVKGIPYYFGRPELIIRAQG